MNNDDPKLSERDSEELDNYFEELRSNLPAPSPQLAQRINSAALRSINEKSYRGALDWIVSPWRGAAVCLIPLAIGFSMGFTDTFSAEEEYEIETLLYVSGTEEEAYFEEEDER